MEDDWDDNGTDWYDNISIHVPRVEDDILVTISDEGTEISIHVPRVEDDSGRTLTARTHTSFQSTSPVWRTT